MASSRRIDRVNSLLKEVISETIRNDLKHPDLPELLTITSVETTKDLRYAKVYVSFIEPSLEKKEEFLTKLGEFSGSIGSLSSRKVRLRYFPTLSFYLDNSIDEYMKIDCILKEIKENQLTEDE